MHPDSHLALHQRRAHDLQRAAAEFTLTAPLRRRAAIRRLAYLPEAWRKALGFRLVETGLRLAVGEDDQRHHPVARPIR